jgi:hypothetical protein
MGRPAIRSLYSKNKGQAGLFTAAVSTLLLPLMQMSAFREPHLRPSLFRYGRLIILCFSCITSFNNSMGDFYLSYNGATSVAML